MQQAKAFLFVRMRQAAREIIRSGPVYGTILVIAFIVAIVFFFYSQKNSQYILYTYCGLTAVILSLHLQRSDHRFISLFAEKPALIYLCEYAFLLLPFTILTLIKSGELFQFLFLLPVGIITLLKVKFIKSGSGKFPVSFTGRLNFEWKAGLRRTGWILLLIWIVALFLTPIPYVSVVLLWFVLLTISTFYESDESRSMVEAFELHESKFLWKKIKDQCILFTLIVLPVLFVSTFFYPENWWISLFFLFYSLLNISVFVVSKYAVWGPGESHGSVTMINTFCLVGFFLPFLLPLPLFVLIRNYFKARNNLKPVLHAYAK